MKPIHSSDLPMEDFESGILSNIPKELLADSEMHDVERCFLNGLLRFHRPKRILEIGVSRGGGSLIMLNAIQDIPMSRLVSIDISKHFYRDKNIPTGATAMKIYDPSAEESNWTLVTGKDPVEIMGSIGGAFDFCVIDTAHVHPVESLNFLVALPYLTDNAVVVLHDIAYYLSHRRAYAAQLLFDCIVADKLFPDKLYKNNDIDIAAPNIGAFQITPDTKKYIANIFLMLSLNWGMHDLLLNAHGEYFRKHYDDICVAYFKKAVVVNTLLHIKNEQLPTFVGLSKYFEIARNEFISSNKIIFYGAGTNCRFLLERCDLLELKPPCEIWDINAEKICNMSSVPVVLPRFEDLDASSDCSILITIIGTDRVDAVKRLLSKNGFSKIYNWDDIQYLLAEKVTLRV